MCAGDFFCEHDGRFLGGMLMRNAFQAMRCVKCAIFQFQGLRIGYIVKPNNYLVVLQCVVSVFTDAISLAYFTDMDRVTAIHDMNFDQSNMLADGVARDGNGRQPLLAQLNYFLERICKCLRHSWS